MNYLTMLSQLGISSAHPGGFAATLKIIDEFRIPKQSVILEVGCGTGRTACHLKKEGYMVTGLDISSEMIHKAKMRAEEEALEISFIQGDIQKLPFENETFDVIFAESVTNFAQSDAALKEYYRVLKPNGRLYDREVMLIKEIDGHRKQELVDFFNTPQFCTIEDWLEQLEQANFSEIIFWDHRRFEASMTQDHFLHPDPFQITSQGAYTNTKLWETIAKYNELMEDYSEVLCSMVMIASK